ncbi:two-component regulator propeller domain-containing protein [Catalinimonas sp. 4WD22]|uniref:two-component regulator propeller domain-containing protein n=1 Tax=Catalinimonas locisalis TaxID=3133978 RepID=UPI003100FD15
MKLIVLTLILFPLSLCAQIKFNHISVEEGLSQSAIYSFTQDTQGYLWIATRDGLNQYDGANFQIYRHAERDSGSIANNIIWAVCNDPEGGIWAATASGISYFDPIQERFYNYSPPNLRQEFPTSNHLQLKDDRLLIATQDGLWIFHTSTQEWTKPSPMDETAIAFAESLADNSILLGTKKGLFKYSEAEDTLTPLLSDTLKDCKAFYQTSQDLLFVTKTELFVLGQDLSLKKVVQFTEKPIYFNVDITEDQEGRIWISGDGIYLLNPDYSLHRVLQNDRFDEYSLSTAYTTDVYTTDDGTVWVGTNGLGIDKYNKYLSSITTISYNPYNANSLSDHYASGMYVEDELLYAGTRNTVDIFDFTTYPPQKLRAIDLSEIKTGLVNKFLRLGDGKILLGTEEGLLELDKTVKMRVERFRIFDMALLPDGKVLVATAYGNKGLLVYNPEDYTYRRLQLLPENEPLRCILVEKDQIWVGSDRVLYKVSPTLDSYEVVEKNETPYPTQIKCIFKDSQGVLWVGTWGNGLYKYDEERKVFDLFKLNEQLPNKTIYGILEDDSNNLWMSTNNGLVCYQREKEQLIRFSADQGLQSNEFNTGSYVKSGNETMFFGGINGISYFSPQDLLTAPNSSRLFITNVWINQARLEKSDWVNESLLLKPDQQNLRIEFTSVSFNTSSAVRYRYKLGAQEDFIDNGNINHINLTNLSSGKYEIFINCTDPYGRWKEDMAVLSFTIRPPLWQRAWFLASLLLGLVALGLGYNHLRVRNYRKKNEKLEQAVQDRTVKIREQNNEILAQNEELLAQGNLLSEQNNQLETQRSELLELKKSLEKRVEARTADLNQKNEELRQQYQQMEQFSYITSHNLKGPVASLKGLLGLLPEQENDKDKLIIENIHQSVLKLDSIINDLAGIMEMRKNKDTLKAISLTQTLKQVVSDLAEECQQRKVKLMVVQPLQEVIILGVKAYLYSIIYNLIHNGIKYRKEKAEQDYVHVNCTLVDKRVVIEVSDNGIGIDMQYAEKKLFRLFQRFNNRYEGKGIGLYMTKIQVEAMKGSISLKSKKGEGTTVSVSFPVEKMITQEAI